MNLSFNAISQINRKRTEKGLRILWPDHEINWLLCKNVPVTNLHSYCMYESFQVIETSMDRYLNCEMIYDDFTHVAIQVDEMKRRRIRGRDDEETVQQRVLGRKGLEDEGEERRGNRDTELGQEKGFLNLILSKRHMIVDQVVKSTHKLTISIIPISNECHLWGGSITYTETQAEGNSNLSLFGGNKSSESYGFNLKESEKASQIENLKINRKSGRRQSRLSNFHLQYQSNKKTKPQQNLSAGQKQCNNTLKFLPRHISQQKGFLQIEIDLINNSDLPPLSQSSVQFEEIHLYGRKIKPMYGKNNYDEEDGRDGSLDQNQTLQEKYRREEVFGVYTMPWKVFGSFLDGELNKEVRDEFKELGFRGSTLKKFGEMCLSSRTKDPLVIPSEETGNLKNSLKKDCSKQLASSSKRKHEPPSSAHPTNRSLFQTKKSPIKYLLEKQKQEQPLHKITKIYSSNQSAFIHGDSEKSDSSVRRTLLSNLRQLIRITQDEKGEMKEYLEIEGENNQNNQDDFNSKKEKGSENYFKEYPLNGVICDSEKKNFIHISVKSSFSYQAEHIRLPESMILKLSPLIESQIIQKKSNQPAEKDMKIFMGSKLYEKNTVSQLQNLLLSKNTMEVICLLEKFSEHCQTFLDVLKLIEDMNLTLLMEITHLFLLEKFETANSKKMSAIRQFKNEPSENMRKSIYLSFQAEDEKDEDSLVKYWIVSQERSQSLSKETKYCKELQCQIQKTLKEYFSLNCIKLMRDKHFSRLKLKTIKISEKDNFSVNFIPSEMVEFALLNLYLQPIQLLKKQLHEGSYIDDSQNLREEIQSDLLSLLFEIKNKSLADGPIRNVFDYFFRCNESFEREGFRDFLVLGQTEENKDAEARLTTMKNWPYLILKRNGSKVSCLKTEQIRKRPIFEVRYELESQRTEESTFTLKRESLNSSKHSNTIFTSDPFRISVEGEQGQTSEDEEQNTFSLSWNPEQKLTVFQMNSIPKLNQKLRYQHGNSPTFKCFKLLVKLQLRMEKVKQPVEFSGKTIFTACPNVKSQVSLPLTDSAEFWDIIKQPSFFKDDIRSISVKIDLEPLPGYSSCLSFLNMRFPKYLKDFLRAVDQKSIKSTKNVRKTIGSRMTSHFHHRKSVMSIEQFMKEGQDQLKQKSLQNLQKSEILTSLPQICLFELLKTDHNYSQNQSQIFKLIQFYYHKKVPEYGNELIIFSQIRLKYISKHIFLQCLFSHPEFQDSIIFKEVQKGILENGNLMSLESQVIHRPRISSLMPLMNKKNKKLETTLFSQYFREKGKRFSKEKSKVSKVSERELEI